MSLLTLRVEVIHLYMLRSMKAFVPTYPSVFYASVCLCIYAPTYHQFYLLFIFKAHVASWAVLILCF